MTIKFTDIAGYTKACGALPPDPVAGNVGQSESADEVAMVNLLRMLNAVATKIELSPLERAFVLGAKIMFGELADVCVRLLDNRPELSKIVTPAAVDPMQATPSAIDTTIDEAANESAKPIEPGVAKPRFSKRKATPGGGAV